MRLAVMNIQAPNARKMRLLRRSVKQIDSSAYAFHAPSKPLCRYTEKELKAIAQQIHQWTLRPQDTEGYGKAEITAGGIDTDELSSRTMEAKKVPGLYFVGEVVDVAGQLGGYNLQWAWSSGFIAGQYV